MNILSDHPLADTLRATKIGGVCHASDIDDTEHQLCFSEGGREKLFARTGKPYEWVCIHVYKERIFRMATALNRVQAGGIMFMSVELDGNPPFEVYDAQTDQIRRFAWDGKPGIWYCAEIRDASLISPPTPIPPASSYSIRVQNMLAKFRKTLENAGMRPEDDPERPGLADEAILFEALGVTDLALIGMTSDVATAHLIETATGHHVEQKLRLKSMGDSNAEALAKFEREEIQGEPSGVACPDCGREVLDTDALRSYPPMTGWACPHCRKTGTRYI